MIQSGFIGCANVKVQHHMAMICECSEEHPPHPHRNNSSCRLPWVSKN